MAIYTIKEDAIDTRDNYMAQQRVIQAIYFFATCFRQFMIFCAKFNFSAQMATMAIGNASPECFSSHDLKMAAPAMENDEKKIHREHHFNV